MTSIAEAVEQTEFPRSVKTTRRRLRRARVASDRNTDELDPIVAGRVDMTIRAHDLIHGDGSLRIGSAMRFKWHQTQLWRADLAKNHGRPTGYVADPNRRRGTRFDGVKLAGSNHMQQSNGWGYAVDFSRPRQGWTTLHDLLPHFGLALTVMRPYEPWHVEACDRFAWFGRKGTAQRPSRGPKAGPFPARPGIFRALKRDLVGRDVAKHQRQNLGYRGDDVDGVYGPGTVADTKTLQETMGVKADGKWGPKSQRELEAIKAPQAKPVPPTPAAVPVDMLGRLVTNEVRKLRVDIDGAGQQLVELDDRLARIESITP